MATLDIEMLPAGHGDALIVTYGDDDKPSRMLIDGGPYYTYPNLLRRILALPPEQRHFEVLVITHIDADHIDGIVRLLSEDLDDLGISFGDIWFNGATQLDQVAAAEDALGAKAGEYLQALIVDKKLPWNEAFGGGPVLARPSKPVELASGAKVRVLSPTKQRLTELLLDWHKVIEAEGYQVGDTAGALGRLADDRRLRPLADEPDALGPPADRTDDTPDRSLANGSSIAFVLEVPRRKALLAADAHADVLVNSINAYTKPDKRLRLNAFKVPHHGSLANLSIELLDRIDCHHFLVSTNGSYFNHPDAMAMLRIAENVDKPHLWFNYASPETARWLDQDEGQIVHFPQGVSWP